MPLHRHRKEGKFGNIYSPEPEESEEIRDIKPDDKPKDTKSKPEKSKLLKRKPNKREGRPIISFGNDPKTSDVIFELRVRPETIVAFASGKPVKSPLVERSVNMTDDEILSQIGFLGSFFASWKGVLEKDDDDDD